MSQHSAAARGRDISRLAEHPIATFGVFAAVYALGAARGPAGGDTGEYMTLAAVGGVAHAPGYPLYTWLLQAAVALVPVGGIPWRASVLSALLAAGALGVLHAALRRLVPAGWALAAVAALGFSFAYWRLATVAEVFAGAALVEALALGVAVRVALGWRGPWAALALGGVAALGVAHHHTLVLMAPLFAWTLIVLGRDKQEYKIPIIWFCVGIIPGFLVYLGLLVPSGGWRWADPQGLTDLAHMLLRLDYGTFSLSSGAEGPTPGWRQVAALLSGRPAEWHLWFILSAFFGLSRGLRGPRRGLVVAIFLSWLAMGPMLVALFDAPTERLMFLQRFYLLSDVLLTPLVALGLHAAAASGARRGAWVAAGTLAALTLGAMNNAGAAPHANRASIAAYVDAVLEALPPDAVLVVDSDSAFSGVLFALEGEGRRPDVALVGEGLVGVPWYARRVSEADPALGAALGQSADLTALLARIGDARPVFLTVGYARRPELQASSGTPVPTGGLLFRRLPEGAPVPSLSAIELQNAAAADALDLGPPVDAPIWQERTYEAWPAGQAALLWQALGEAWARQGNSEAAKRCLARARAYRPDFTDPSAD